jgi:hypothetical protein
LLLLWAATLSKERARFNAIPADNGGESANLSESAAGEVRLYSAPRGRGVRSAGDDSMARRGDVRAEVRRVAGRTYRRMRHSQPFHAVAGLSDCPGRTARFL